MLSCSTTFIRACVVGFGSEAIQRKHKMGFVSVLTKAGVVVPYLSRGHFSWRKQRIFEINLLLERPSDCPSRQFVIKAAGKDDGSIPERLPLIIENNGEKEVTTDDGDASSGGTGGDGKHPRGRGGNGGDSDGGGGDDREVKGYGPILSFDAVMKETKSRGATLPSDMLEAARSTGIPRHILLRYLDFQGSSWPFSFAVNSCSMLRNRLLADPSFLFKLGTEIVIDTCCATFAEVQKRGDDFWAEFELFTADLLVGLVVNVALVGMLAPYVRLGLPPPPSKGLLGHMQQACRALPSSVFEAERPGCKFSVNQRLSAFFLMGTLYAAVGFTCGIIGQGIANAIMNAKRSIRRSEDDVPVPPLIKSAALWGAFLAVSSNTRYQIVNGLERMAEASPIAKAFPPAALAFTVSVRLMNNVYGGMQFVDWARWSGVQ